MKTISDILKEIFELLFKKRPASPPPAETTTATEPEVETLDPLSRKVLLIAFDPKLPEEENAFLSTAMGWNDPFELVQNFITDLKEVSGSYAAFEIAEQHAIEGLPVKKDGFTYKLEEFVRCCRMRSGFHQPDEVDYYQLLRDFDILEKVQDGVVDEVWVMAPPFSGFYESTMAGEGAFFCNANPLGETSDCKRRFILMGFNYERGLGEMWESLGHRAENIMQQVYRHRQGSLNLWERFTRVERTDPGRTEVGTIHYAPNSTRAYEWGSRTRVLSACDNWSKFPDLSGSPRHVDCDEWGGGDSRLHHMWWFRHLPHIVGLKDGVSCNWWKYILDPNKVR